MPLVRNHIQRYRWCSDLTRSPQDPRSGCDRRVEVSETMTRLLRITVLSLFLAGAAGFGLAQSALSQEQQLPMQVPLTPEMVEAFVTSYPELQQLGDMKAAGLLTDEEFAAAKAKLLA